MKSLAFPADRRNCCEDHGDVCDDNGDDGDDFADDIADGKDYNVNDDNSNNDNVDDDNVNSALNVINCHPHLLPKIGQGGPHLVNILNISQI